MAEHDLDDPFARRRNWLFDNRTALLAAGLPILATEDISNDTNDSVGIEVGDFVQVLYSPVPGLLTGTQLQVEKVVGPNYHFPDGFLLAYTADGTQYVLAEGTTVYTYSSTQGWG